MLLAVGALQFSTTDRPASDRPDLNNHSPRSTLFAHAPATNELGPPSPPPADIHSKDSAERLVANSGILREVWHPAGAERWQRETVLRCASTGQKLNCREVWRKIGGDLSLVRRSVSSGEQVLVEAEPQLRDNDLRSLLAPLGFSVRERIAEGLYTVSLPPGPLLTVAEAIARVRSVGSPVLAARPDHVGFGAGVPNDPIFPDTYGGVWGQWNLRNTGVRSNGVAGADIAAIPMWDVLQNTPGVTIAVLDSGLRTNHPDLAGISWQGTNMVGTNSNFTDDEIGGGHGTGITAVMAARRDNGIGIAGIVPAAQYLIVKVLNNTNYGTTSDVIKGLDYARSNGASIVNMSLVGFPNDSALREAIARCESEGILLCISAGNNGRNNDTQPDYPSSFTNSNIISVANHDWMDRRWNGGTDTNAPSNYGATNVDLFAPGALIPSAAQTNNAKTNDYLWWTGTSVATPHVTAVAAMIKALNPAWTAPQIKQAILTSVVTNANYTGLCVSGGRLDALGALGRAVTGRPADDSDADGFENLLEYLAGTRTDSPASQPVVTAVRDATSFSMTMPRSPRPYAQLAGQRSTNLQTWTTDGVTNGGSDSLFRASISPTGVSGFLRAVAVPVP